MLGPLLDKDDIILHIFSHDKPGIPWPANPQPPALADRIKRDAVMPADNLAILCLKIAR